MSLSPTSRQTLARLVQAHDDGCGPVEKEAVQRLASGLPMTALQIRAFAETAYPADIRAFLEANGYQALYRRDLDRALALGAKGAPSKPAATARSKAAPPRKGGRFRWLGAVLRLLLLAAALLAAWLILTTVLPRLQREAEAPRPRAEALAAAPAPAPPPTTPPSPCVQALRDGAAAWCESALTGSSARAPGGRSECGDRLKVNSDTVRLALDQIFRDAATYTYGYAEVPARCAAAAKLAAP